MRKPPGVRIGFAAVAVVVVMSSGFHAVAQEQGQPPGALSHEREFAARLESAPEQELKIAYLRCSHAASQRSMGGGDASMCSMVYEALLGRVFGGDFEALLAWSRLHPNDTLETDVARGGPTTRR